jgi:hypothetical protein
MTAPAASAATTYYVSPTGSDSNPGTSTALPWKSIGKVNATVFAPGDRILFQAGQTFAGKVYLDAQDHGTASSLIVVGSYGTGRATINGGSGSGIFVYDTAGVRVENLKVVGTSGNTADGISFFSDIAVPGNKLDTIQVDSVEVSGFGKSGVVLGGYAYDSAHGVVIKTGFQNVRLTNISAHDNADAGISTYGPFSATASGYAHANLYIGGCSAYHNPGISGKGSASGSGIVLSDVQNALIENSVAYDNGQNNNHVGGPVGMWAWDSDHVTIQSCQSYSNKSMSNDGGGFDLDGGCTNCVLQNNYSHDNVGCGFVVYQFWGARPQGNNTVRNNTSVNDARTNGAGLAVGGGVKGTLFQGNQVTIGPRTAGATGSVFAAGVLQDGLKNTNTSFLSNTFNTQGGVPLVVVNDVSLQIGILFSGNTYSTGGGPFSIIWGNWNYTSLSAWHAATGQGP